jgi:signal transduction histidine kinase
MAQQELKFTVDSALLRELGEKLVETVHLALSELVKNSYDADATEVEVIFETTDQGKNRIKIIDNGVGMNFKAVEQYWMRIATSNKEKKDVSTVYGRHLTGAKGIGRFSCRRLGAELTLITKGSKEGNKVGKQPNIEYTQVYFPWTKFEAGTDVTTISCPGNQKKIKEGELTGTILIIDDATDEWSHRGFSWLKRQLAVLSANQGAKREGFKEDPGFTIMVEAPDFEGSIKDIREDMLNAGWGTLTAHINSKKQAVCKLDALGLGRRTLILNRKFEHLSDLKLELGIMIDNSSQLRDKSVLSLGTLQKILPEWGGVQVRYRGFRVPPYGDDDWLDIDYDRGRRLLRPEDELMSFAESLHGINSNRALLSMPGMKNYVGSVEIGAAAKGFDMKANREGFIESPATRELKKFVRLAIDWSTILREYYLRQEDQRKALIAREDFEDILDEDIEAPMVVHRALDYLEREIKSVTKDLEPEVRHEIETNLTKATEAIRTQNESQKSELTHLRLIASTSTLLLIFSHEVKSLLGMLEESKNSLEGVAKSLEGNKKDEVLKVAGNFKELNIRLRELLQLTSLLGSDKSRAKPGRVAIKTKIKNVEKVFELITSKYGISIDYSGVPNNVVVNRFLEAEIYSIFLNLISNSIKAVIAGGKRKEIQIEAHSENGVAHIIVRDSGIGLSPDRFKEVFAPFISDPEGKLYVNLEDQLNPEDDMIVGTGSGLGLGIVREIVKAHDGDIAFKEPKENWSTELEIQLQ